jgi:hypothetical protein
MTPRLVLGQPRVDAFGSPIRGKEYVVPLDVSMHDARRMSVCDPTKGVEYHPFRKREGKSPCGDLLEGLHVATV